MTNEKFIRNIKAGKFAKIFPLRCVEISGSLTCLIRQEALKSALPLFFRIEKTLVSAFSALRDTIEGQIEGR
jgi:hypothetical protein